MISKETQFYTRLIYVTQLALIRIKTISILVVVQETFMTILNQEQLVQSKFRKALTETLFACTDCLIKM